MANDGVEFDGSTPNSRPMGGAEAAFPARTETLVARGLEVIVRNNCAGPLILNGVQWAPISQSVPDSCALYIGNRGHRLIGLVPKAGGRVFGLHNPGGYLLKPRYLWPLLVHRPAMVFSGTYHASTVPWWVPDGGRSIIPYGLEPIYRTAPVRIDTPPPVAIFTSNPLRGLDWLLELWVRRIHPAVPKAELHLYCGPVIYGAAGDSKAELMGTILGRADGAAIACQKGLLWSEVAARFETFTP